MEKLKVGEVAILDDGREFICFDCLEEDGINLTRQFATRSSTELTKLSSLAISSPMTYLTRYWSCWCINLHRQIR